MAACKCRSRAGSRKQIFRTENHARDIAKKRGWVDFWVYPCHYKAHRYHLTSHDPEGYNDNDRS